MTTPWNHRYAQRMHWMHSSAIRELLKLAEQPDIISFAGGLPAPELFPVAEFAAATERVLSQVGPKAMQYSTTEGYLPLREFLVSKMAQYGIIVRAENVLITSGSQQALDMIGKLLLNPGDLVLTEAPTYLGALQAWNAYQAEFDTVPIDQEGLRTDLLENALSGGPKFMYVLPNFQNPGGVTLSLKRRQELVRIADRYGVPIIEDDPYGELRFEGDHLPPLLVQDARRLNGNNGHGFYQGNVIYLSTFSKTLAPGLRLGWMVAPVDVIQHCVIAKQGMDLHTSTLNQMVAYEVIAQGDFLKNHVRRIRQVYRERRDVMIEAMEQYFPDEVHWTEPHGGLFLWVTLPEALDSEKLMPQALANKVAYVPGHVFYPDGRGRNTMRFNFSNAQPANIEIGIRRLGELFKTALAHLTSAEYALA
ncbi:MAG: PLP-dependent aminotransferase family protein [Chloroflexi bacterium]|nr:PLP-dependent aminotransferase family protein [Chloroflexota bacterium]MBP8057862.1 PLP-dependent aminotransferase family protein [Chloroflexota bacterium]